MNKTIESVEFTREDVRWHRELARQAKRRANQIQQMAMYRDIGNIFVAGSDAQQLSNAEASARWHESMAERITEILPPKETES